MFNVCYIKRTFAATCFSAVLLTLATPASANTSFTNGNFESVSGHLTSFSLEDPAGNLTALTGWNILGTPNASQILNCVVIGGATTNMCGTVAFGGNFSLWANPGQSPNGGNYYMADGDDSTTDTITQPGGYGLPLYQTVTGVVSGATYDVSFYQAAAQQNGFTGATTEQWEVAFCPSLPCSAGNTQYSNLMSDANHSDVTWASQGLQTLSFTATAATEVLEFIALGLPNGDPPFVMLDGVTLTQLTPEPGTYMLIGLGLLAIPLAGRLLKKRP